MQTMMARWSSTLALLLAACSPALATDGTLTGSGTLDYPFTGVTTFTLNVQQSGSSISGTYVQAREWSGGWSRTRIFINRGDITGVMFGSWTVDNSSGGYSTGTTAELSYSIDGGDHDLGVIRGLSIQSGGIVFTPTCQSPALSCPPTLTADTDPGQCTASTIRPTAPTATGGCGTVDVTGTRSDNEPLDAPYQVGDTTITWTAIDDDGQQASCQQTVTVTDRESPSITCPPMVTVTASPGECVATGVSLGRPTTSDNCGVAGFGVDAPTKYGVGDTIVTWTVADIHGNRNTCQQTVRVTAPALSLPSRPTITANTDPGQCTASGVRVTRPTATGGCGSIDYEASRDDNQPLEAPYPAGDTTVTWTATDDNGQQASCQQTVRVTDNENPTITCPSRVSVNTDAGKCTASGFSLGAATVGDNCGVASVSNNAPAAFPVGDTPVTWTVTDIHGNTATGTQIVTVRDATAPTISGVSVSPNRLWPPNHGMVDVTVNYTASDLCGAVTSSLSVTSSEPDGGLSRDDVPGDIEIVNDHQVRLRAERAETGPGRTYTITITSTDSAGNTKTATATVVVPKKSGSR